MRDEWGLRDEWSLRDEWGFRDLHTTSEAFQAGFWDLWGHAQSQPVRRGREEAPELWENERWSPWGLRQLAGIPLLPLRLQVLPCFVHSFGNWAPQRLGQPWEVAGAEEQ